MDSAIANAFERRLHLCGLSSERIVKGVGSVWILSQYDVFTRSLKARCIGLAGGDWVIVVWCAPEDADRPVNNFRIGSEGRHAVRVKWHIDGEFNA